MADYDEIDAGHDERERQEGYTKATGKKQNKATRRRWRKLRQDELGGFTGIIDETVPGAICAASDEWELLELTVDAGAAETICPAAVAKGIPTEPGEKFRMGASYTCASGKPLPNLGEKRCDAYFGDSPTMRGLRMQVADISRPLLSVSRAVDSGCGVVFDQGWSYIEDKGIGEKTSLVRKGGLYVLDNWVKAKKSGTGLGSPFGGPGAKK